VEALDDCETLKNEDVIKIFEMYGWRSAPAVIKGLVPKRVDCSDETILKKYTNENRRSTLHAGKPAEE
jgi:hypothetical protein